MNAPQRPWPGPLKIVGYFIASLFLVLLAFFGTHGFTSASPTMKLIMVASGTVLVTIGAVLTHRYTK